MAIWRFLSYTLTDMFTPTQLKTFVHSLDDVLQAAEDVVNTLNTSEETVAVDKEAFNHLKFVLQEFKDKNISY